MTVPASYSAPSSPTDLGQRGRASMQVLGSVQVCAFHALRTAARDEFLATEGGQALAAEHADGPSDAASVRDRLRRAGQQAGKGSKFRLERFLQRYVAEENWRRGIVAVEAMRERFSDFAEAPPTPKCASLELDASLEAPAFHSNVEFHLQPGGWEGYDLYGPVLSNAIYPHVFARGGFAAMPATPAAIGYRPRIIGMLPRSDYRRVFEVGCGSGSTTRWLHQAFPQAQLTGCDISAVQLKAGFAVAEKVGVPIRFKQRDGRETGEPADSFDLVVHNAVAHEMPPKANIDVFREIFRILEPGGDFLMMDPPPFRDVGIFEAVLLDWETENRDEPFFRSALLSDWEAELSAIGFVDVKAQVLDGGFPWVLTASKPRVAT